MARRSFPTALNISVEYWQCFCFVSNFLVAVNGEEAWWGASSTHAVWHYSGKLAGKPNPEGISEGLLPGAAGHTLPGCRTGRKSALDGLILAKLLISIHSGVDFRDSRPSVWLVTTSLQVKSVKPCLKQLQQCIQTISTLHDDEILPSNPADLFHWLPKEHMCVLVYLVMRMFWLLSFFLRVSLHSTS